VKWTKEQQSAIDFRENKNLLLAAAAGSGKTAVLVERILKLLTDKKNPVSVSSLLVLTFTEAAASEMKRKIKNAIRSALEKNPQDEHLRQQNMLVSSASVSTIDSFCKRKLSEYMHLTDLPADFTVISDTEANILLKQATDEVLEKYYSKIEILKPFKELCISIGNAKNNLKLKEILMSVFKFSESMPYPAEWLSESVKNYKEYAKNKKLPKIWQKYYEYEMQGLVNDAFQCIEGIKSIISELPEDHKYVAFYSAETELICSMLNKFVENGFTDEDGTIKNYKPATKVRMPKTCPIEEKKADALRTEIKNILSDISKILIAFSSEADELSTELYKRIKTFKNIVLCIRRKYKKLKLEKSGLDFSDLEHEFLKLISDRKHKPTQIANELKEKYSEILLDEYQDTNNIQDEIFRLISRDNKNIFMVGDLKQSIYKFRNAMPKLFSDKYKLYSLDNSKGQLIRLFKNFRSRREVIDCINFIFSGIMSEDVGDICYNTEEYLIEGAEYPSVENKSDFDTEFCLIKRSDSYAEDSYENSSEDSDDENSDNMDTDLKEAEARFIANRICELFKDGFMVYDSKLQEKRPIEYRDIVILLRNRTSAPLIEAVLEENSIPVYTDTGKSYLNSREVSTILSFLSIIDNPYQDIPLIAVMKSSLFSFSNEELAEIRVLNRKSYFYDAVCMASANGDEKVAEFCKELEFLRKTAEESSIYRLILTIYERYNYMALAGLMGLPDLREANLRLLLLRALEFEKTKITGLFGFMNYIESIKEEKKDLSPAKVMSENENVVRIMTVHKSKGLEFPVVFLSDTSHIFNKSDMRQSVLWHEEAGISIVAADTEKRVKFPSLPESLLKRVKTRELKSEEMRLLYVALTRAKEKLIITSALTKKPEKVSVPVFDNEKKPLSSCLKSANSFSDWLIPVLITHKSMKPVRELFMFEEDMVNPKADFGLNVQVFEADGNYIENYETIENTISENNEDDIDYESLKEVLAFMPENNENIPLKMTVSEVKRRFLDESEYTPRLVSAKNMYLKKKSDLTAAEIGTVTHFVLQYINEKTIDSPDALDDALSRLVADRIISKAQREIVNDGKILAFLESPLGVRLKNSKKAYKEFSFYSEKKAGEIFDDLSESGKEKQILLQGTIDCFFEEEDGKVILIDYKTDNVTKEETKNRALEYKIQIDCYREALEKINKKKIDESYIYFLNCAEIVKMD